MSAVYYDWKHSHELEDIRHLVGDLGIPELYDQFAFLESVIRKHGQVDYTGLHGRNLLDIYKALWTVIL
jgi:hypothetical protein